MSDVLFQRPVAPQYPTVLEMVEIKEHIPVITNCLIDQVRFTCRPINNFEPTCAHAWWALMHLILYIDVLKGQR